MEAWGGAFVESEGDTFIINNTVYNNSAVGMGGALHISTGVGAGDINLYNNIAYDNSNGDDGADIQADNNTGTVFLFNNDFTEFCGGNPFSCDPLDLGANQGANKDIDPMFVDAMADDFRLLAASDLIDMGTDTAPMLPATDRVGNPRIFGPQPDMGALEAVPQIVVDPVSFDYGQVNVGAEGSGIFTISNLGTISLNVSDIHLDDDTNFTLNVNGGANPCGSTSFVLAFDESCTLEVLFNPQTGEVLSAVLSIASDDPNDPSITVDLTGTGVAQAGGCGCSLEQVPPMISHLWLWILPMVGLLLWRRRRSKIAA